ncbi:MAG: hypothetical protein ACRENJ_08760, partial [Candidatus Eiseniibacteriota bacterium]
ARAGEPADRSLGALLAREIERFLARPLVLAPGAVPTPGPPDPPPGPPIGGAAAAEDCEWRPVAPR